MMRGHRQVIELVVAVSLGLAVVASSDIALAEPGGPDYILFDAQDHINMSGSAADLEHVRRARQGHEPVLWFREGGTEYLVRDAAALAQVSAIWAPAQAIGDAEGTVGERMSVVGTRMGELGTAQANRAMADAAGQQSDADRRASSDRRRKEAAEMRRLQNKLTAGNFELRILGDQLNKAMERSRTEFRAWTHHAIESGIARPLA